MWSIGGKTFHSRLLLGTGKFTNLDIQKAAFEASDTEILTFALRRMDIHNIEQHDFLEKLDFNKMSLLPNTSGAKNAREAIRLAKLAQASGLCDMIKVEIIGCEKTLMPDPLETLKATEELVKEGFIVLPYTSDDVVLARKLEEVGAHAVMPSGSPIGSGLGILNPLHLKFIVEQANVPVLVDAGIGSPADAAKAMELGADAVLLNTAVAEAQDPVKMAEAMKFAVRAGRLGYEAGRMAKRETASASSPLESLSV